MPKATRDTLLNTLATPDPEVLRLLDEADEITERILAAAFEQIAVVGWRRSTVEDVAKRAGLGRATVYRKFPSKNALTEAVLLSELRKYLAGSTAATSTQPTATERMAESCAYTVEFLHGHPLLRRLLETEPEAVLPALTTGAAPIVDLFQEFCVTLWKREFYGDTAVSEDTLRHLRTVAELHIRITLSLILTQPSSIPLDTADQARDFARRYLAPMLDAE
ncbi:TetR/AcrR family transcriptional regulator [Nocardia colli]|uniref:TetR/AcrR family transcriptional regulator n=1 Tax=Nocardia colli TaxID=2545717 RepID=A0A5N0EJX1_9NOCA|nr:TetR/AcrR family transcriptional regulator [Nocardia colli]KAA8887671.1 TetR/AcrR family transcriptional regulator [Nocardia colli]